METIPIFPLSTVLFPQGKMALQIFEPRYLDLISQCLKNDQGFGVVWLREGKEVYQQQAETSPRLAQLGTFAYIVDWDSLKNGLLGITIEGGKKFRLVSSYQQENHLHMAEIEWIEEEVNIDLPAQPQIQEMKGLLAQLVEHPHVERLKLSPEVNDVSSLGCLLAQLLPIDEANKFELLSLNDPVARVEQLSTLLEEYL
jgi:Lon protease-like protein